MPDVLRYPVPAAPCRVVEVIDRSRFICTVARAESTGMAQGFIRQMKAEFSDATHNCWAYVIGAPGATARVGMSDDGEPHGTAGRPMLTVLLHSGVGEIVAVVTRYFGGTKLGTGGLVRAYSSAVQAALAALQTMERIEFGMLVVTVGYTHLSAVLHLLPGFETTVTSESFTDTVTLTLLVPRHHDTALRLALGNATHGQVAIGDDGPGPN